VNPQEIIDRFYPADQEALRHILITHSQSVMDKALHIVDAHPELQADRAFVAEAAMLHDIGIIATNAPGIHCFGTEPYIRHGLIGASMLRQLGYERHALVCERHTGAGISRAEVIAQQLPLPLADYLPLSVEEQIICFADKFFSKTHLDREKTVEQARNSLLKFSDEGIRRFDSWCKRFL